MVSKDRPEQDLLIQLEAARSSLASSISSLIESMLEKDLEGRVSLDSEQINALLRSIKK